MWHLDQPCLSAKPITRNRGDMEQYSYHERLNCKMLIAWIVFFVAGIRPLPKEVCLWSRSRISRATGLFHPLSMGQTHHAPLQHSPSGIGVHWCERHQLREEPLSKLELHWPPLSEKPSVVP